jgi:hypothetical protein
VPERLQLRASAAQRLSTPTPRVFYINDDLTDEVRAAAGTDSEVARLIDALFDLLRRDGERVVILTERQQLDALMARGPFPPFSLALGLGRAGERVAQRVHAHTGWFPAIRRVEIAREEDGSGGYRLVTGSEPLVVQLAATDAATSLAVVDDTVFSGLTMRSVLLALSPAARTRARAFCLRAVAETLQTVEALCPVAAGIVAPGRILDDVSFINASGLVRRGAIRRAGQRPLAFFERAEWMRAWFPGYAEEVTRLCRELNARLPPPA